MAGLVAPALIYWGRIKQMAEWIEYTGSDEQIEEIINCKTDVLCRYVNGLHRLKSEMFLGDWKQRTLTHYLICQPHPYADEIKIWADTGCEVYVCEHHNNYYEGILESTDCFYHSPTNKPNWNIPGAEYRLTPFED